MDPDDNVGVGIVIFGGINNNGAIFDAVGGGLGFDVNLGLAYANGGHHVVLPMPVAVLGNNANDDQGDSEDSSDD